MYVSVCILTRARPPLCSLYEQLHLGIRYLDLRAAGRGEVAHVEHGSYGPPLLELLAEVRRFVHEHDKEVGGRGGTKRGRGPGGADALLGRPS